ncbi:MAG: glycosyltransferase [Pasteurellaceae bacterium]|nr:glycosyltransferase [Pasteurellaceae bacterium]
MGLEYLAKFPQEHAIACTDASLLLNLLADHQYGWALYEKRWDTNYKTFKNPMVFPQPKWTGEFDHSVRLFVYSEQGIGDNIQFLRYVILLKQQGLDVLVLNNSHIDDYLAFNLRKYDIECVKLGQEITFTYWIPMMSLPHLLDCHLENIPYSSGYLSTSGDFLQKWQAKVPAVTKKKRIGVVWKGNSDNGTDSIRSIPLSIFSQLFSIDADFHCLQKEISEQDLAFLEKFSHVYTWHTELESFFDTSALLAQLDLIICIDSSVAHLSGAMGKPCWLLINHSPDFRWLLDRNDSIWYDSVRLFRQDADFNWGNVIRRVENKLRLFIQQDMK